MAKVLGQISVPPFKTKAKTYPNSYPVSAAEWILISAILRFRFETHCFLRDFIYHWKHFHQITGTSQKYRGQPTVCTGIQNLSASLLWLHVEGSDLRAKWLFDEFLWNLELEILQNSTSSSILLTAVEDSCQTASNQSAFCGLIYICWRYQNLKAKLLLFFCLLHWGCGHT